MLPHFMFKKKGKQTKTNKRNLKAQENMDTSYKCLCWSMNSLLVLHHCKMQQHHKMKSKNKGMRTKHNRQMSFEGILILICYCLQSQAQCCFYHQLMEFPAFVPLLTCSTFLNSKSMCNSCSSKS